MKKYFQERPTGVTVVSPGGALDLGRRQDSQL